MTHPVLTAMFGRRPSVSVEPVKAELVPVTVNPVLLEDEKKIVELMEKVRQLEIAEARLTKQDERLSLLTEEEVGVYFAEKIITLMTPEALRTLRPDNLFKMGIELLTKRHRQLSATIADLTAKPKPKLSMPLPPPMRPLKKVTVVGLLSVQAQTVEERLRGRANFYFVSKNRTDNKGTEGCIPRNQDIIVLAANFISHSIQDHAKKRMTPTTKLIVHHGGVAEMIRKLDEALADAA